MGGKRGTLQRQMENIGQARVRGGQAFLVGRNWAR